MKIILFAALGISILSTACKKLDVEAPDLQVTLQTNTLKVGDTAKFDLSGYADYINFYSGEPGKNYDRKDSFTMAGGNPEFQFSSAVSAPGTGITTGNNLSVLVSTDFNGKYDAASVSSATWTNVTSRTALATTTTTVASPIANLNDLKVEGKPMYVAFRYQSATPTLKQRQWTISSFQFRTKFPNGTTYTHASDNTTAAFGSVNVVGDSATWVAGTTLTHVGLNANYPADDDWAITKAFDLSKANSDASGVTVIKNFALTGAVPSQFTWKYAIAGTYKAVFVFRNATKETNKEVIKDFTITVNP
jgi:hypothetical protein